MRLLELLAKAKPDALASMQRNNMPVQAPPPELRHPREAQRGAEMMSVGAFADKPGNTVLAEMPSSPADLYSILRGTAGASRAAADFIKRKRWYHGTGTKGLTPESIDPYVTNPQSLYGQGLYLTDDSYTIPSGYAKSRAGKSPARTGDAGSIYEAKVAPKKVLDLDDPSTPEIKEIFADHLKETKFEYRGEVITNDPILMDAPRLKEALKKKDASTAEIWDGLREDLKDELSENWGGAGEIEEIVQGVTYNLQQKGYDALTHTGGARTGNDPHQVLIMLDPNDAERLGSGGIDRLTEQPGAQYPKNQWPMFRK